MGKAIRESHLSFGGVTPPNGGGQLSDGKFVAFAMRMREHAGRVGLSQTKLAHRLKLTSGTFNRYWSGERLPPSEILIDIAEVLNVSPSWLIRGVAGKFERGPTKADYEGSTELPEYDLTDLAIGGKAHPIGSIRLRADLLDTSIGESQHLWIGRALWQGFGVSPGSSIICKDHLPGDPMQDGHVYLFAVHGGIVMACFSYRGDRAGGPVVTPSDLAEGEGQHVAVACVCGLLFSPLYAGVDPLYGVRR